MKKDESRGGALLKIHAATVMFGIAGLFGKWLDLPAEWIVLGRAALASVFLFALMRYLRESIHLPEGRE